MEAKSIGTIGKNLKALRTASGLSTIKLAELSNLSRASIVNIETGKTGYNIDLLEKLTRFFQVTLADLSNPQFRVADNFRGSLAEYYKKEPAVYLILHAAPTIVFAVTHHLLTGDFLHTPREINEVKRYFAQYGWNFKGTSIQNTLKRLPELILIRDHPLKRNTKIYSKK